MTDHETQFFLHLNTLEKEERSKLKGNTAKIRLYRDIVPVFERWYRKEHENNDTKPADIMIAILNFIGTIAALAMSRLKDKDVPWDTMQKHVVDAFNEDLTIAGKIVKKTGGTR